MIYDTSLCINTSRRWPIVFCLDISTSMGMNKRIENLNLVIKNFYEELQKNVKALHSVEVAVVTFSNIIEENTDFQSTDMLKNRMFSVASKSGTNLSTAVLTSIKKIEDRLIELDDACIDHYAPILVLVTDGDPDQTDSQPNLQIAIQEVLCHSEIGRDHEYLIVPYIIGVGEEVADTSLNRFTENFTGKAIIMDDDVTYQKNFFRGMLSCIQDGLKEWDSNAWYKNICQKTKHMMLPKEKRKLL